MSFHCYASCDSSGAEYACRLEGRQAPPFASCATLEEAREAILSNLEERGLGCFSIEDDEGNSWFLDKGFFDSPKSAVLVKVEAEAV